MPLPRQGLKEVHVKIRSDVAPAVSAANLEMEVTAAAMRAAIDVNTLHGKLVIEVLRAKVTNAPDGGVDAVVRYDPDLWPTPADFAADFAPRIEAHCRKNS